ncbi:hypothetical protein PIB30_099978 [Stylosanthes scabra]|uniref:Replication factor A C-terminal domain-containing protein n=1 Tax=Stylosanthes scabra TaxID=79078 RepID=A0ABU6RXF5_9FABA|nr:hypothetical protein [Stylosanthes scabra]
MKIDVIIKCTEECKTWIAGNIVALNNGMHDWHYNACANCGKKVDCAPKGRYECTNEKCLHIGNKPRLKYKVEVMVYDGTECLNLLMWDTQVIQLCAKRADQVAKEDMEELGYPPTLDNLVERNVLFKISVKLSNIEKEDRVYTVSNICEDENLLTKYLPYDFFMQENVTPAEMDGSNSLEDSHAVANLETDCDGPVDVGLREDSVSTKTPPKRAVTEHIGGSSGADEPELEGQLSTNKFTHRGGKRGKLSISD